MSAAIPHLLEGKVTALLLPVAFSGSVLCFSLYVFGYCNVERVIFFSFLGLSFNNQCLRCTLSHTNFYFMMLKGIFVVLCSAVFLSGNLNLHYVCIVFGCITTTELIPTNPTHMRQCFFISFSFTGFYFMPRQLFFLTFVFNYMA